MEDDRRRMRFTLSEELLRKLRAHRASQAHTDDALREEDAFLLDAGLGPCSYLTTDGRVLVDCSAWDENDAALREATDDEATCALVVGAKKTGIADLLTLVPAPPHSSVSCPRCDGERWMDYGRDVRGQVIRVVCPDCSGRGWKTPRQ